MAWGAAVGLGLGILQNYEAQKSYREQLGYETEGKIASINAAKDAFLADIDALVVQNFINEELAANAIVEAERAGGAVVREAQVQIKEGEGKILAASEGITAGASKARELSSFYVQASKKMGQAQDNTTKQVVKIADNLNKTKSEISAAAERSYQNMKLAIAGVSSYSSLNAPSVAGALGNLVSGVQTGRQFKTDMTDLFADNKVG